MTYFDRPKDCRIEGDTQVTAVVCDGERAALDGVFLLRPTVAPTDLFPGLAVENGYVSVDRPDEHQSAGPLRRRRLHRRPAAGVQGGGGKA